MHFSKSLPLSSSPLQAISSVRVQVHELIVAEFVEYFEFL